MTRSKLESDIVSDAHDYARIRGWWTIKVETPTMTGVPDRLYLRHGEYIWIEWKKPNGVLSMKQITKIKEMRSFGARVYVFDNLDDAKAVLK